MSNIRNIAVIAHVDHGKTTLIDALLKQSHVFRDNQEEMGQDQLMDTNELERERGITIMAKNCAIEYKETKINIIDTPGHADFSGEVERTLGMAEGALLIVDAQEGPMPQTRFVLRKALELNLKIIVVINKIDKKFARVETTISRLTDLFLDLATNEDQIEFPTLFAVGRLGKVFAKLPENIDQPGNIEPLLDTILEYIPAPNTDEAKPFKMLVSALDYDNHLGRIAIGKVAQGTLATGKIIYALPSGREFSAEKILKYDGLARIQTELAETGDIVALAGAHKIAIGDTISTEKDVELLPAPKVEEPTLIMTIGPNTSPFAGREGTFVTGRNIEERLVRELENNVGLKLVKLDSGKFKIAGRGELHLSILLETMRREGFEMEVGKPEVIIREINGVKSESVEEVNIIVPNEHVGTINQELGKRQSAMQKMEPISDSETEFVFTMPTRALIGLKNLLLTLTKGTIVISSQLIGYEPVKNALPKLRKGAIISTTTGRAAEYGLRNLKGRGVAFVVSGDQVYEGMVVGEHAKDNDIEMNVTKEKQETNHRSKPKKDVVKPAPDLVMSLEQAIDFLETDELLEITPESLRLRKRHLTEIERKRHKQIAVA